jgi:hypothetical protein
LGNASKHYRIWYDWIIDVYNNNNNNNYYYYYYMGKLLRHRHNKQPAKALRLCPHVASSCETRVCAFIKNYGCCPRHPGVDKLIRLLDDKQATHQKQWSYLHEAGKITPHKLLLV